MARLSTNNAKIIVDDYETKVKLKELSDRTGESMKAIIKSLVEKEYIQFMEGEEPI
jgi:predicted DNA-binding protein